MTASLNPVAAPNDRGSDDDLDARCRRIRGRIIDGIEATLDELALPDKRRAAIERAVQAQIAALVCRQAICRRARRCRRKPCTVPAARLGLYQ